MSLCLTDNLSPRIRWNAKLSEGRLAVSSSLTKTTIAIELTKGTAAKNSKARAALYHACFLRLLQCAGKTLPMWMKDCPELETIFLSKQRGHGAGQYLFPSKLKT
jgi:hypothetical protein